MNDVRRLARLVLLGVLAVLLASPAVARAYDPGAPFRGSSSLLRLEVPSLELPRWTLAQIGSKKPLTVTGKKPKSASAPELDPSTSGAALVLILGATLVAFGRRRRKAEA